MMLVAGLRTDPRCRQLFSPPRQDPIADALRLIESNPAANWTVERLARSVGMGRSNFAAHFTQAVGRAPMELVAEQRMEHAASLLRQGQAQDRRDQRDGGLWLRSRVQPALHPPLRRVAKPDA
jgi:transcriptional regulator GlxA family with amidase domain